MLRCGGFAHPACAGDHHVLQLLPMQLDKCTIIGTLRDDEQKQTAASSLLPYDDRA